MKSFILISLVATCGITFVTSLSEIRPCAGKSVPIPTSITVNDCTTLPCLITKDGAINALVNFATVTDAKSLTVEKEYAIDGKKAGVIVDTEVCNALVNTQCPLKKDTALVVSYHDHIPTTTPRSKLTQHIAVYNEKRDLQTCFEFDWLVSA